MLIDTHCHVDQYSNVEEIIREAEEVGVMKIISVSMGAQSQEINLRLAKNFTIIYAALGIHPQEVENNPNIEIQLEKITEFILDNKDNICAIGEIGLDHYFVKNKKLYPLQTQIFNQMLQIAQKLKLPVNLHTKGAEKEVFETLPSFKIPYINIHWYSGSEIYLKQGIDRGYYFSITPAINYSPLLKRTLTINLDKIALPIVRGDGWWC
ncbi:MAG: TatD family hydrolase [Promethearchaeota archaeon]